MSYRHGVYTSEQSTSVVAPVNVDVALPVAVGIAPVHKLATGVAKPVNEPKLIYTYQEFVETFGWDDDPQTYGLCGVAKAYLSLYGVAPVVFINVFDPATHKTGETPDPSKVVAADVIGGIDATTLARTGLELVSEVFPRFRLVPGQILCPGFSQTPSVAVVMGAKCTEVSGHFTCTGIVDVPATVTRYTDVPAWINDENLTDPNLQVFFGSPVLNDVVYHGSSFLAGTIGKRDAKSGGVPFWSPSNNRLLCSSLSHAGKELHLDSTQAAYLNGQGVITGLNFVGGLKVWGNRTAAYPGITDVKDSFIPVRRMFNWVGNTIILTAWQMVDWPLRRRTIETVCDTVNCWFNGLTSREYLLGGRVAFLDAENPSIDLLDGIARFHVYMAPPPPARDMEFVLEYDVNYLNALFGASS